MVEGVWLLGERYKIFEPGTDNEIIIHIPGADTLYDASGLEEICHWQRESADRDFQARVPRTPLTKNQQHDLGQTLVEIRDSHTFSKENLHGRYW